MSGVSHSLQLPTEKEVEHACDQLMQSLGWTVIRFSQPRNTMQTHGIPDRRYYPSPPHVLVDPFWFECKAPGGRQSPYQRAFQEMCERVEEPYVIGGVAELVAYLRYVGIPVETTA